MIEFLIANNQIILRLLVAVGLGLVVGAERRFAHKEAGMKTHALVSLGAALFVVISEILATIYGSFGNFDPGRVASQIIVGIGFLGAGSIIFQGNKLSGLTTAGGLWVTAGIGMAAGFGMFGIATMATIIVLLVLLVVNFLERPLEKLADKGNAPNGFK